MHTAPLAPTRVDDELDRLAGLVPLAGERILEPGCGPAAPACQPDSRVTGLEVDARQHAKNLATTQSGLPFVAAGARAIPSGDRGFERAMHLRPSRRAA